jgi:predicted FMN-binding regulatory protein PaiB
MYLPKHFSSEWNDVKGLIEENGFATVLSFPKSERPFINHLPLVLESESPSPVLVGHFFEKPSATPWEFELPDDLLDANSLTSAIVSFRFTVESFEAKFKLSQNRSRDDREGVIDGLSERGDDNSKAIRAMMRVREGHTWKK